MKKRIRLTFALWSLAALLALSAGSVRAASVEAPKSKPNILVIWGDDIGYWNPSAYHRGTMGHETPNIDRLAREEANGNLAALRYDQWKLVFLEQRAHGLDVWQEPFVPLRLPRLINLRSDPFERADRLFLLVPAQAPAGQRIKSIQEFPPRQTPGTFSPWRRSCGS